MHEAIHAAVQAGDAAARQGTESLRKLALGHGWNPRLVEHLSVEHDGGHFEVQYPKQLEPQVHDHEYGSPSRAPRAAIRQFQNRIDEMTGYDAHMAAHLGAVL